MAGAGRAADELTLPAFGFDEVPGHVVALADIDRGRLEDVGRRHQIEGLFDDVETMLDRSRAEILVVNSPVSEHYRQTMMAIERGLHFILEKPATDSVGELETIRDAAAERGVKGTVVHNLKCLGGFEKAFGWYRDGTLGEILHVDRVFMTPPHEDRMEMDEDGWWHRLPGGRLADSLPHHFYIAYPFVGEMEVEHVSARKLSDRRWSVCDEVDILLRTQKGYVNVRMSTNQESWPAGKGSVTFYAFLFGTKHNAALFQNDAYLIEHPSPQSSIALAWEEVKTHGRRRAKNFLGMPYETGVGGGHGTFFQRFLEHLEGHGENPTPWPEAIHTMKLTELASRAMDRAVRVG